MPNTLTTTTGDIIYASGANTPARLAVGSTDDVLTVAGGVPTWAAPAGGGAGLNLISTVTMSAVSAQNLEGIFTSTYTNYLVTMTDLIGSAFGTVPRFQLLSGTNTVQATGYYGGLCGFDYSGTANSANVANTYSQTHYTLPALGNTVVSSATMMIFSPNTGVKVPANIDWKSGYTGWRYVGGVGQNTAGVYTGLRFTPASGTISGTISVYGLAK